MTTTAEAVVGDESLDPRRWRTLAVLALVQFVIVLDNTIVNVALPAVQASLHVSTAGLAWVVNGYLITAGGLLLLGGRLCDVFGRRRLFLLGTTLFAVASLTSGLAVNGPMLIASRLCQGAGEALASPAALSLIAVLFPAGKERTKALGIWGGLSGIGATLGVLVSGVLVQYAGWRWIFLINLPLAACALVLVPRLVAERRAVGPRPALGLTGAVLITTALATITAGLLGAADHPWGSRAVLLPLVVGAACLAGFAVDQRRSAGPLVPHGFFADRLRRSANLLSVVLLGVMAAMLLLFTLYLQQVRGLSPLATGVAYLPFCFGFGLGVYGGFRLYAVAGGRVTAVVSFVIGAAGMLLLARVGVHSSYAGVILPAMLVVAPGLGMGLPALQNAALHALPERDAGLGSGVQTAVQALGSALGNAVFVTIAVRAAGHASVAEPLAGAAHGFRVAFAVGAAVLAVGAVVAGVLLRPAARPPGLDIP